MKFKSDEIGEFIASMKKEIIEASDSYINIKDKYNKKFIILDYSKILALLTEYMKQYSEYLHTEKNKYKDRIIGSTTNFFNTLSTKGEYKKEISIGDFKQEIESFVDRTKAFQTVIKEIEKHCCCDCDMAKECENMITLAVNQYIKIGNVFRTDLNLYDSIRTSGSKSFNKPFTSEQSYAMFNEKTPCMHIVKG